jgi:hypothetical protein
MGILIDYQEAKAKLGTRTVDGSVDTQLGDALEQFAFSRLPKRNRIALVLVGIYGGEAEQHLQAADEIAFYATVDFAVPYAPPKKALDISLDDVLG